MKKTKMIRKTKRRMKTKTKDKITIKKVLDNLREHQLSEEKYQKKRKLERGG